MRIGGTSLVVIRHGIVDVEPLISVLAEVYSRVDGPDYVELHVYENRTFMENILVNEAVSLGVVVNAAYTVMHEAWRGYPRIHVVSKEFSPEKLEHKALLVHEAMHSILHGGLEYYLVSVPKTLLDLLGSDAFLVYHIAATIVKDLEVHMLMKQVGYEDLLLLLTKPSDCSSIEGVSDFLKAATALIVLGEVERLGVCAKLFAKSISKLKELVKGSKRPWERLAEFASVFTRDLMEAKILSSWTER